MQLLSLRGGGREVCTESRLDAAMEGTVHILVQGKIGLDQAETLGNQQCPDRIGADARYDDLFGG